MNIAEKLKISAYPQQIALIREGMFLRVYQQSLYGFLFLRPQLKILSRTFKNLGNKTVFYAGFPESALFTRNPNAVATAWGFTLPQPSDAVNFAQWEQTQLARSTAQRANDLTPTATGTQVSSRHRDVVTPNHAVLTLSEHELNFLQDWQVGKYPPLMDSSFIQGLKHKLLQAVPADNVN